MRKPGSQTQRPDFTYERLTLWEGCRQADGYYLRHQRNGERTFFIAYEPEWVPGRSLGKIEPRQVFGRTK